jgi:hypothetical protein
MADASLHMLKSKLPEDKIAAATWLADNQPDDKSQQDDIAAELVKMLDDLSPKVTSPAVRALKLWASKSTLTELGDFARRQEAAEPGKRAEAINSTLIDLLAQWKDETAAEDIAVYLRDPKLRDKAAQALLQLGSVSEAAVLHYLNHPDNDAQKEARRLVNVLKISEARQLDQSLVDLGDSRKPRVAVALARLAKTRPDDANRAKVSKALNAPLLDADSGIRDEASAAVRAWATADNTASLVKVLGNPQGGDKERTIRIVDNVTEALITIGQPAEDGVITLVKTAEPLIRFASVHILGEIGTAKSLQPLSDAAFQFGQAEPRFFDLTQAAIQKIMARK